jgi:hypothetical protein
MTDDERVAATTRLLLIACRDNGAFVTGDQRVGEDVAAHLLGLAPGTLANRRGAGNAPRHYRIGGNGHRVSYRLDDLAAWIEGHRGGDW